jgi:hypothetical protein
MKTRWFSVAAPLARGGVIQLIPAIAAVLASHGRPVAAEPARPAPMQPPVACDNCTPQQTAWLQSKCEAPDHFFLECRKCADRAACETKLADAILAEYVKQYELAPVGAFVHSSLEKYRTASFPAIRGRCYGVSVRLGQGAKLDDGTTAVVYFDSAKEERNFDFGEFSDTIHLFEPICPQGSGRIRVVFEAHGGPGPDGEWREAKIDANHDYVALPNPGKGSVDVQLFAKRIDEARLREDKESDELSWCQACLEARDACLSKHLPGCGAEFTDCLQRASVPASRCRP